MTETNAGLSGKVAIVTGASAGIGAEIARALHAEGASVFLVGRNQARLKKRADAMDDHGEHVDFLSSDITDPSAPEDIIRAALNRFGKIDVLVHVAGVFEPSPFSDTTDEILDRQWNINVRGPFRLTRTAVDHMSPGASIVFVSSIAGHIGFPNSSAYCATKGAVELLVKSLTAELSPLGIRVNAVAPGNVRTNINAHLLADPDYEKQMLDLTPAGRIGEVEDIAPAVVFLASPAASYIHGASLLVDGGWVAR
jgi:NAD(P)-dependent dehydrogenase (short-subunit alcohol dehydrogenase family)